jgi:predicted phage terminase large subunit-like protein
MYDELDDIELLQDIYKQMACSSLIDFTCYTNPKYTVKWFHRLIADKIDLLLDGKIKNLMIFMPAQHGKSTLVSQALPAFTLGKYPDTKIACCTYASALAKKMNRAVQRIIDGEQFKELFPEISIGGKGYEKTTNLFEVNGRLGSFQSTGIGGSLSGFSVDLGIIDDAVKNMQAACSETIRETTWEWFNSVFRTRQHNNTKTLLTFTRWHDDDLAGRILESEADDWEIISLPYIKEEKTYPGDPRQIGEALWPEKHNAKKALKMRENSERIFQAMCQQHPTLSDGAIFKATWFKYYQYMPQRFDRIIMSWDCAFKATDGSSYVVGVLLGMLDNDIYLIAMTRGHWDFVDTVKQIKLMKEKFPYCQDILIEDKANGTAVLDVFTKEGIKVEHITPIESKESRAYAVSFYFESGNVFFPANCQWVEMVESEMKSFPFGKNNDIVDSITQGLRWLILKKFGKLIHMGG